MRFIDLTGRKFGRLTVIERAENSKYGNIRWLCRCECGNETIVRSGNLTSCNVKSCGCSRTVDLTGQTFGRLTVIEHVGYDKHRNAQWRCKCDCGNEAIVNSYCLTSGNTKSCGCYHREIVSKRMKKGFGEATFNRVFKRYKRSAKKEGREFSLSEDEVKELMSSPCEYCGQEPSNKVISKCNNGDFQYNGIDRIDNTKGYANGNVVPSCSRCNFGKHAASENKFISCIKAIYEHLDLGENFS